MRSIDSLREYAANAPDASMSPIAKAIVAGLADSIEREVEDEWKAKDGQSWLHGYAECRAELMEGNEVIAASLEEAGWVKLPVSDDGNVLYIGDLVDEQLPFGGYAAPAPIDTMELSRGASGYCWMVKLDAENRALVSPKLLRHHHAPTVEDVLREFADGLGVPVANSYLAATAAKLRLAEDNGGLYEWERDE